MNSSPSASFDQVVAALRHSHDRLQATLSGLGPEQLTARSYCRDWSRAQVASHLGSGADIFSMFVEAGRRGHPAPGFDQFPPVWERWNAKSPPEQAADCLTVDRSFLEMMQDMAPSERDQWHLEMFGAQRTLTDVAAMRLSEHALHTWDIVVSVDGRATLASDAVLVLVDWMGARIERVTPTEDLTVALSTVEPERSYVLELAPGSARLRAGEGEGTLPRLHLPAEAFIRLVAGRLDPAHTPLSLQADGIDLDALRRAFPGF